MCSCSAHVPDPYTEALYNAGDNRAELESVITHYTVVDPDTLKLKAARYLIGEMKDKSSVIHVSAKEYDNIFMRLPGLRGPDRFLTEEGVALVDSAVSSLPKGHVILSDLKNISADFIIANIDSAFEQWVSAGRKTAEGYELTWDDIPTGTLYLVVDRTKGVENRIFTYEIDKQIWW